MSNFFKNLIWAISTLLVISLVFSLFLEPQKPAAKLSLNQLVEKINNGEVKQITVNGDDIDIKLNDGTNATSKKEAEAGLIETLKNYGVDAKALQKVEFAVKSQSGWQFWAGILIPTLLPLIIIGLMFWLMFRQARTGVNQAFSFGRSNLRLSTFKDKITFKDVAGLKESKEELREVVEFLKNPKKFLDLGARIPRGILLMGLPGTGKCITGESLVFTNKGLIEIQDIPKYFWVDPKTNKVAGAELLTMDPEHLRGKMTRASRWFDMGESPTKRIILRQGIELEGTPEHPVVIMNTAGEMEFKKLEDIAPGDLVAIRFGAQIFGSSREVNPEQAYLMGLITGDGNMSQGARVELTTADPEIAHAFKTYIHDNYENTTLGLKQDGITHTASSWQLKKDFYALGMSYLLSYDKSIPPQILQAPKEVVIAFLQGLFDADGYFDRYSFGYATVSKKLSNQVTTILLNLGVVPKRRIKNVAGSPGHPRDVYEITVSGTHLETFTRELGFRLPRKQNQIKTYLETHGIGNTNIDVFYHIVPLVEKCWRELSAKKASTSMLAEAMDKIRNRGRVSRRTLSLFVDAFQKNNIMLAEAARLKNLLDARLFFSPVEIIEDGKASVYDFTVPRTHSFIANGVISHNTLIARAVAGESNVPFFHISASEFVEMFVGVGASVDGETPVLIKNQSGTRLVPIKEFADRYYASEGDEGLRAVEDTETLGYQVLKNKFWGTRSKDKTFFNGSRWSKVKAVYRHKVDKAYKISYRGGSITTTGDHSVFVREGNMIKARRAAELRAGDILVNLPFKVRSSFISGVGTTHKVKAHNFEEQTTYEIDLYEKEYQEQLQKYRFVMENRNVFTQAKIGAAVGVAQSCVHDWQLGKRHPRFFGANVIGAGTPPRLVVTKELLRLLGYYTAEGSVDAYATNFTFGIHEKTLHQDCAGLIRDVFKLEPGLLPRPETNSFRITISSAIINKFFEKQCGNGSHNKHIPEILWSLPKDYFLAYLEGYVRGDGYTTKDGKLSAASVSRQLIRELAWLCAMHGIQAGVQETTAPKGRIINKKPLPETKSWNLIIGKTAHPFAGTKPSFADQFKKPIVKKIEEIPYNDFVYDLCGCENEAFFGGEKPTLLHNSRTRDAFMTAKKAAPSILFIDEIDAVGRQRGAGLGGGNDEREQTLNQILVELDGFDRDTRVIVLAASVTGDTPVLTRKDGEVKLLPIGEVIDAYYKEGEDAVEKDAPGLEVLGFDRKTSINKMLKNNLYFGASAFKKARSVFRHKVKEIYEIEYIGGKVRATGNHSVFVRTRYGLHAKPVAELRPGEILADIPYLANHSYKLKRELRAHKFAQNFSLKLEVYNPVFEKAQRTLLPAYQYALSAASIESQSTIAQKIGFSQTAISKWQRGISAPRGLSRNYFKYELPEAVEATPELMRLFGYYTAEGYARKEIDFCFNVAEKDLISDVEDLMRRIFGLEPHVIRTITKNAVNIIYQSKPLAAFFIKHCGKGARGKHVPSFLFEAPKEYFLEFLRGYSSGDGHEDKRGRLEITSVSKQLITELNWLCRMHGIKSFVSSFTVKAGRKIADGEPLPQTQAWRLGFGASQNPFNENRASRRDNIKRAFIRKIRKVSFGGYVYDFCGCENEAFFGGETPVLLHNTNRPDILDPALLRPGRFDRRVVLDLPDLNDREAILKIHSRGKVIDKNVDLRKVAVRTPGFSGADLANLMNEAAILAARRGKKAADQEDFFEAVEKVLLGPERRSRVISPKEKEITAFHEGGHALVAASLKDADPIQKVSIISRGIAGGYTMKLPIEEQRLRTKKQFLTDLAIMMGGYASEKLTFGDVSTGASSDLKEASELARRLVTKYGMSETLGPQTFGKTEELIFLGREIATEKNYSEEVAAKIDKEVQNFISRAYQTAQKILRTHKKVLQKIAKALIEKESLEQEDFYALLKPFKIKPMVVV